METSSERLAAFGNQLIEVHLWLREQLEELRAGVDGAPTRELRAHCLAFCSALDRHHTGEDGGAFPELAERFPELRPVLDELRRDHRLVEDVLRRIEALAGVPDERTDPVRTQRELDTLAALLETHFQYEEKRIVSALNALDVPEWRRSRPPFSTSDAWPPISEPSPVNLPRR